MKILVISVLCLIAASVQTILFASARKYEGRIHDHDMDWWHHGVFYQIYPRSFKDSDGNGEGDLKGIISKLDHLKDLGVTGTWLSPIFKSPMKDGGYDIENFYEVDERFGTNEDLKDLFRKAKENDIKVILDFVPNHTSDQHEWFKNSALKQNGKDDWYIWRDCDYDKANKIITKYPNNWRAVFRTPAWSYNEVRKQCYLHQYAPQQPDLNYRNKDVKAAMFEMLEYWLDQGADGFRVDAIARLYETETLTLNETMLDPKGDVTNYHNYNHTFTKNLPESYQFIYEMREIMEKYTKKDNITRLLMSEAYASVPDLVKWYGDGEGENKRIGAHIPFNFMLISKLDKTSNAKDFHKSINSLLEKMPNDAEPNWVMGNHDRSRIASRYGKERAEGLAIMTMMLPGVNIVYYGEEIMMVDNNDITWKQTEDPKACASNKTVYKQFSRDPVRTPMQWDNTTSAGFSTNNITWLPVHEEYLNNNLAAQKNADKSTFKLYKKLIEMRKNYAQLKHGGFYSKTIGKNVFGFVRNLAGEKSFAFLMNLGGTKKIVSLKDLLEEDEWYDKKMEAKILIVNNDSKLIIDDNVDPDNIELDPYDSVVLEVSSVMKNAATKTEL